MFVLHGFLETHILVFRSRQRRHLHQNGQNSGFAVEMTLGGTYGGILAEDLLPVPPSLKTRTKRGFTHFHSDDDGGLLTSTKPNPTKIGGSYRFLHRTVFTGLAEPPAYKLDLRNVMLVFVFSTSESIESSDRTGRCGNQPTRRVIEPVHVLTSQRWAQAGLRKKGWVEPGRVTLVGPVILW